MHHFESSGDQYAAGPTNRHKQVLVDISDNVALVILNRPECRNAVSYQMLSELIEVFDNLRSQSINHCVIVGQGQNLGVGADLDELLLATRKLSYAREHCARLIQALVTIARAPFPTVAVVHGIALGASLLLSLSATYRIGCKTARMIFPFSKLGIVPDHFTSAKLEMLVGDEESAKLLKRRTDISHEEAFQLGLVDARVSHLREVVPPKTNILRHLTCHERQRRMRDIDMENIGAIAAPMIESFVTQRVQRALLHTKRAIQERSKK